MRLFELLLFPLRTLLVVLPLWFVYWLFQHFHAGDVSGLHRFALWLSVGMLLLSGLRTTVALRGRTDSALLRGAHRMAGIFAGTKSRRWCSAWRDGFVRANFSERMSADELRALRRLELFALTPLRITAGVILFLIGEIALPVLLTNGTILSSLVMVLWYVTAALYTVHVLSHAFTAAVASGGRVFEDARKLRGLLTRFRR